MPRSIPLYIGIMNSNEDWQIFNVEDSIKNKIKLYLQSNESKQTKYHLYGKNLYISEI